MRARIRLVWLAASALLLCHGAALGQTEPALSDLVWHCWYDADGSFKVKCFTPEAGVPTDPLFEQLVQSGDLIGATRVVRQASGALPGTMMYIPIYIHPMRGMEFVARLARAVMCRGATGCTVAFDPEVPTVPAGIIPP